jgi:hypothetical protein
MHATHNLFSEKEPTLSAALFSGHSAIVLSTKKKAKKTAH